MSYKKLRYVDRWRGRADEEEGKLGRGMKTRRRRKRRGKWEGERRVVDDKYQKKGERGRGGKGVKIEK